MTANKAVTTPPLEAATFYLTADRQFILEEIRLKLRRRGIKASKSKLVRVAILLFNNQTIEQIIANLHLDQSE